eukprot:TRINITY_DN955_c0_g1_i1.p1 TRINITY_DN955_c0_g1~~TRINITY_DN955_c0_g1_i1.p1  ORF type:complete len:325 (+),score=131.03 TRINITY_DN955_c0_g1_i1:193-1167(+)
MASKNKAVGVDDMVMLRKVTEPAVVENLKIRYTNSVPLIYTYIGPVLIATNPYKDLHLTGEQFVKQYRGQFPHENPPHIYALAEEAYRAMKSDGTSQCVIISGESGAGKTESAKIIMGYISMVSGKSDKVEYVKRVILDSNPLLEAFGNAKTLRNNNSSRFGKYFEIQFDIAGDPCGGKITNYLLEKSRVVYQQHGERNFHIFYNLLSGATQEEMDYYTLYEPHHFFYLKQGGCYQVEGVDDRTDYGLVRAAMTTVGIDGNDQGAIMSLVAGILHLGNVTFCASGQGSQVADAQALELAASLLCVEPQMLTQALCYRVLQARRS